MILSAETLSWASAKGQVRNLEQLREEAKWSLGMNSAELEHCAKHEKVPKASRSGVRVSLLVKRGEALKISQGGEPRVRV